MTFLPSRWTTSTPENDTFVMDGSKWRVDAVKSYGFSSPDNNTLRFELRKGDRFSDSSWTDPSGVERVEVLNSSFYKNGTPISIKYQFMIEPGPVNTAKWAILGQIHADVNKSPPLELALRGNDKLQIIAHSSAGDKVLYAMPANLIRGKWYDVEIDARFNAGNRGTVDVWLDGQHVVDYSGTLGQSGQTKVYWREGIYRKTPSGGEKLAVNYKNLDIEDSFSPQSAAGMSAIRSLSASDTTVGETLIRNSGTDKRYGTLGDDTFLFDVAPGVSNSDDIVGFDVTHDALHLDASIFTALAVGPLPADALRIGPRAVDANDRIIYDHDTGILSYDADGSGNGASVQIARLATDLKIAASNFHVV
jgi:hypothetical protein